MARNEEKQYGRLNRLHLQQQREEELKKKPPRPKLHTLNTVNDVKKWLPSITRDIDFNLKQSEVTCYTELKIREFGETVRRLQGEYWAFVRKIKQLDPQCDVVPWTERGYSSSRKRTAEPEANGNTSRPDGHTQQNGSCPRESASDVPASERLVLPLVDNEKTNLCSKRQCQLAAVWSCTPQSQDKPLEFAGETSTCSQDEPLQFTKFHQVAFHVKGVYSAAKTSIIANEDASQLRCEDEDMDVGDRSLLPGGRAGMNPLGIDYASSSSSS